MVMLRYFAAALALILSLGLPSCDLFQSELDFCGKLKIDRATRTIIGIRT